MLKRMPTGKQSLSKQKNTPKLEKNSAAGSLGERRTMRRSLCVCGEPQTPVATTTSTSKGARKRSENLMKALAEALYFLTRLTCT